MRHPGSGRYPQKGWTALDDSLPTLLLRLVVTLLVLAVGVTIYTPVTPFHERALMVRGNVAAGTALSAQWWGLRYRLLPCSRPAVT
jgi:uncharacterized membrane protein YjfL (UPF0719 family)